MTALAVAPRGVVIGTTDGAWWYDPFQNSLSRSGLRGKKITSVLASADYHPLATVAPEGRDTTLAVLYSSSDPARGPWLPTDGAVAAAHGYYESAYSVVRSAFNAQQLFLGLGDGPVLRSSDGGVSWQYAYGNQNTRGAPVYALATSVQRAGLIWAGGEDARGVPFVSRSNDTGATWLGANPPQQAPDAVFSLQTVRSDTGELLFAGLSRSVLASSDGGITWTPWFVPGGATQAVYMTHNGDTVTVVVNVGQASVGGAPSLAQVFRSLDLGQHWDSLPVPVAVAGATAITATGEGALYLGTYSGLWMVRPKR